MPLTNMNIIMDDLAEVAYFVKEITTKLNYDFFL